MRGFRCLAALLMTATLGACAPPAAVESPTLAATTQAWADAFNAGRVDAVAAMYTADSRAMPPNAPMETGRDGVKAAFQGMIDAGLKAELANVETSVSGDLGYKVGTYEILGPNGSAVDRGKFIEVWKQIDGQWLISNDIWNSDLPEGASATSLLITHTVEDSARWLAAWQGEGSRHGMFAEHGAPRVRVFQAADKPKLTALLVNLSDPEAFQGLLSSPAGATAMDEDGVNKATVQMFTEVK